MESLITTLKRFMGAAKACFSRKTPALAAAAMFVFHLSPAGAQVLDDLIPVTDSICMLNLDKLATGELVDEQFAGIGIHISATAYQSYPDVAIIFDTDASGTPDPDIEVNIGNVLILPMDTIDANNDMLVDTPDKSNVGGIFVFDFDNEQYVHSITVLDVDNAPLPLPVIKLYDSFNNLISMTTVPYGGNGSVQVIDLQTGGVARMEVHFPGSGAIGEILLGCPDLFTSCNTIDVTCFGGNDGSASVSVFGGYTPYTYAWDANAGNQVTPTATGLAAGSYIATITDATGQVAYDTCVVSEPDALTLFVKPTPANCKGQCDGSALVSAIGGNFGYTYLWNDPNAQTTAFATGLCAGTYIVTVTDALGCSKVAFATITEPPAVEVTTTGTGATCVTGCNGAISANATGGTFTFSYAWDDPAGQTTATATGLCPGTYTVTATDANGCTDTSSYTIVEPDSITMLLKPTPPTCKGECNGSALVSVLTGNGFNFTYHWSDPSAQTTAFVTGLCAGTYTVTVTDLLGCTAVGTVVLTEPTELEVSATGMDASCNGVCDGSATATASGGTPNYTYQWNDPGAQTTATATGLCAGTYTVIATDMNGCADTTEVQVNQPGAIAAVAAPDDTTVCGSQPVQLLGSASGGLPPYAYAWTASGGNFDNASSQNPTYTMGMAGAYSIVLTVTDANGCSSTDTSAITIINCGSIGDYVWCDDNGDGIQDPGEAPIAGVVVQLLDDMGNVIGTMTTDANGSYDFTGLPPGMYTVNVVDSTVPDGKSLTTGNDPMVVNLGPGEDFNDADFGYQYTGSIGDYVWCDDNGDGIQDPGEAPITGVVIQLLDDMGNVIGTMTTDANGFYDFTNLPPGMYTVNVVDSTVPDGKQLTTGNDPMVVNLGPGEDFNDADFGYEPLGSIGDYVWCDTNNDGIQDPGEPPIAGVVINLLDDMGNIIATMTTDANGFYDFTGLPAGMYTVDVVDSTVPDGKVITTNNDPLVVNLGPGEDFNDADFGYNCIAPNLTHVPTPVTCAGGNDGAIDLTVSGGTGTTFTFAWSNGAITEDISGLSAGTYSVTVTDQNGCSATATENILEPDSLLAAATGTDASCADLCDGSATVTATGGNGGNTFQWDSNAGNQTTATATGLCAGTYSVTVTDSKGCTSVASVNIDEPNELVVTTSGTDVTCNASCDGSASATVTGGTAPYAYSWNDPSTQSTAAATGLCAGTYEVTVTDANGCSTTATYEVLEPAPLTASATGNPASCFNVCDGDATVTAGGGNGGYTYAWGANANNQATATATGLCAGTYTVTVTDSKGCTATATYTVIEPAELVLSTTSTDETCAGDCDGTATAAATGGNGGVTYQWDAAAGSQTTATATGLCTGIYYVTATDINGCSTIDSVTVEGPAPLMASATGMDATCADSCNGMATVLVSGGNGGYTFLWDANAGNQTSVNAVGLCDGTYSVTVTDSKGCTATASVTINEPAPVMVATSGIDASCNGQCDGTATASATGGTGSISYQWDANAGNQTTATATGLCAGTYSVTATDANGCISAASYTVGEPPLLIATTSGTPVTCFNSCDGTASVAATGGNGGYTYAWDDPAGQTTATATGLCAGTYNVTVTDSKGCSETGSYTVAEPAELVATATSTPETCFNDCDGTATVTATGGNGSNSYLWDANAGSQTTATATGLCVGTYHVTVTDLNGCTDTTSVTVTGPPPFNATATGTQVSCNGFCDGTATANPTGGTGPYSYLWNDTSAQVTQTAIGLCAGTYEVTVTDANGCTASASFEVTENESLELQLTGSTEPSCFGTNDGTASVFAMGGTGAGTYTYMWDANAGNQTTATATGLTGGIYNVTVTDTNSCSASISVELDQPKAFSATIFGQNATCDTICDGVAVVSTLGGTGTMNMYQWNDPDNQTTAVATGLCPGTYTVTATDVNGCTATASVTINANNPVCPIQIPAEEEGVIVESQVYPNPFSNSTNIMFSVAKSANTVIQVFDASGHLVLEPFNEFVEAGQTYTVKVTSPNFVEGIYYYQIINAFGAQRKAFVCMPRR